MAGRIIAAASLLLLTGAEPALDYGPAPTFERAVELAEAAARDRLIDPGSAQFEWPFQLIQGTMKPRFGRTKIGYYTCGFVNARNRMGGYTGRSWIMVVIRDDRILSLDIGVSDGMDPATITCDRMAKNGELHRLATPYVPSRPGDPARAPGQPPSLQALQASADRSATSAVSRGGIGVAFLPTPIGATILAIAPGSAAEQSGLKPGETLESVNGISLKGFSQAEMIKVLQAAKRPIILSVIGVGEITIPADPAPPTGH